MPYSNPDFSNENCLGLLSGGDLLQAIWGSGTSFVTRGNVHGADDWRSAPETVVAR
jgi:hypothetical protein